MQELEGWQRGDPGLALVFVGLVEASSGKAGPSRPLTVVALQRQQSGTPAFSGYPRTLRSDNLSRRMDKIAQHLPPDGGIRIEQPVQHRHAAEHSFWLRTISSLSSSVMS
jgi:hypothetical protein